ncbi:MAG TPA: TIR domain-containing protein [Caulobacteraceae bacterium]|nr:TIR domain-containing protein [Caulobacteraceae bacterium]
MIGPGWSGGATCGSIFAVTDVFISYERSSEPRARQVADRLKAGGYTVWLDADLPTHRAYTEVIREQLEAAKVVLVLWTAEAAQHEWVRAEADLGRERRKLVQASLDGSLPPLPFNQIHSADLSRWRGGSEDPDWTRVVQGVAALAGPAPSASAVSPAHPASPKRRAGRWLWVATVVLGLLAVVGAGWFMTRPSAAPLPARVAVLPFDTAGGTQDAAAFADGLMDEVLGALSNDHVVTVSRTESAALRGPNAEAAIKRLGVGLVLDGSVQQTNGSIIVRLHMDDAGQQATIWSDEFSRPTSEAEALQAEVAARAARTTTQALGARAAGVSDPATLSDFVTGDELVRFEDVGFAAAEPYFRRVIARAPRFAGGHAYLANDDAFQAVVPGAPRAADQRAEARREAETAIRLDPKGYDAFIALALITPPDADYWRNYEAPLLRGQAVDPTDPTYPYFLSDAAAAQGRLRLGAEMAQRAVAMDTFWPGPARSMAYALAATGQVSEAEQVLDRMQRIWPGVWATVAGRFWTAAVYGDPDAAIALLSDPRTRPFDLDPRSIQLWRSALTALKSNQPAQRAAAAAAVKPAALAGQFSPSGAVMLLARFGDLDGAFAVANAFPFQVEFNNGTGPPVLFVAPTAPLRRDPRFMQLAARLGLVNYWRATGAWPDFCAEPGLPYDCKAEAARLG